MCKVFCLRWVSGDKGAACCPRKCFEGVTFHVIGGRTDGDTLTGFDKRVEEVGVDKIDSLICGTCRSANLQLVDLAIKYEVFF